MNSFWRQKFFFSKSEKLTQIKLHLHPLCITGPEIFRCFIVHFGTHNLHSISHQPRIFRSHQPMIFQKIDQPRIFQKIDQPRIFQKNYQPRIFQKIDQPIIFRLENSWVDDLYIHDCIF